MHGVEILGFYDLTGVIRYLEGKTTGIETHMEENEKFWKNQKGFWILKMLRDRMK